MVFFKEVCARDLPFYRYLFSLSFTTDECNEVVARLKVDVGAGITADIDSVDMGQAVAQTYPLGIGTALAPYKGNIEVIVITGHHHKIFERVSHRHTVVKMIRAENHLVCVVIDDHRSELQDRTAQDKIIGRLHVGGHLAEHAIADTKTVQTKHHQAVVIGPAVDAGSDAPHGCVKGIGLCDVFATHIEEARKARVKHTPS